MKFGPLDDIDIELENILHLDLPCDEGYAYT